MQPHPRPWLAPASPCSTGIFRQAADAARVETETLLPVYAEWSRNKEPTCCPRMGCSINSDMRPDSVRNKMHSQFCIMNRAKEAFLWTWDASASEAERTCSWSGCQEVFATLDHLSSHFYGTHIKFALSTKSSCRFVSGGHICGES